MRARIAASLKKAFVTGVLVLAPLGVTLWVFATLVGMADGVLARLPEQLQPEHWLGFPIPGLGVVVALLLVLLVGMAASNFAGRQVVELYERLLARVPVVSSIYQGIKQLVQTVTSSRGQHFRKVVLVEYPRRDAWCLAFLTSEVPWLQVEGKEGDRLVNVFLPTTPNPTSGFYLLVPLRDLREVPMSVEEAFKVIMSAGIVTPGEMRHATVPAELAARSRSMVAP